MQRFPKIERENISGDLASFYDSVTGLGLEKTSLPLDDRGVPVFDPDTLFANLEFLNEDHYGLEKVKERILEYLSVTHLVKKIKGPIDILFLDADKAGYLDYLNKSVEILCTNYGPLGRLWFDGNWSKKDADWQEKRLQRFLDPMSADDGE